MNIKYILGAFFTMPLLPILYVHAKKIKASVPKLPEASGTEGRSSGSSKKVLRMLVIGESTMAGVGVKNHHEGFTGALADELATLLHSTMDWKVYAKSGYTARKVIDNIVHHITEKSMDFIIIGLGANDAFELNTPSRWNKDVSQLITRIRQKFHSTPILFVNMPPIREFPAFTSLMKFILGNLILMLGKELEKLVKDFDNVYYYARPVDSLDLINRYRPKTRPQDIFIDGVHPSKITYQIWAKDVSNFISQSKDIRNSILLGKV